jgi:HSP20 family protein
MASFLSTPGTLFDDFEQVRREMDSLLASAFGPASIRAVAQGSFPAVNVGVTPESVDVYLLAPGVDPAKLDVNLEDHVLTVSGERPKTEARGRAYLRERFTGAFRRAVTLPDDIDAAKVQAQYQNGVLHIAVGRRGEAQPRRIEIK